MRSKPSYQDAFAEFEQTHFDKANLVAQRSWQLGQITNWQNRLLCQLRNTLLRYTPIALATKQKAQIFSVPNFA